MSLAPGTRLGPYEILTALGAGGMGEVYQARDTRLDRTVAVKVLPAELAADPEFRERFEREARSISALDHPHICALYDVGEHQGTAYLVMQHLDGETLADRLARGALPLDQALTFGIQIAHALDQAHRRGIVHRDLKPGNVMLTTSGAKLLDFGLAKRVPPAVSSVAPTALATSPVPVSPGQPLTAQGSILGTFRYMAPEQIEGRDADARTDIFAFGALLYEMITGRRAFEGATQAGLIAAILEREPPPITTLAPPAPAALDHVVRRALAKRPDDRWQSMLDVASELEWIAGQPPASPIAAQSAARLGVRVVPFIAGLLIGAVLTGALIWKLGPTPRPSGVVRAVVPLPSEAVFGVWAPAVAISPDGRRIVYTAMQNGEPTLFLRPIDSFDAEPIRGTAGAKGPVFSPDGQQLAFFSHGKLRRVTFGGSLPVVICDAPDVRGATWTPDDTIVFAPAVDSGLAQVPATGGTPQPLTTRDESKRERTHRFPRVLPGGKAVVFIIGTTDITTYADARIAVQRLDGGTPSVLVEGGASPRVAAGHLFYSRGNVLMAAPFDESRLQLTAPAFPVANGVAFRSAYGVTDYDVAIDGTVIYAPGGEMDPTTRLVWVDRAGRQAPLDVTPRFQVQVMLSADAQRLLLWDQGANDALWVRDLRRGTASRVTPQGNIIGGSWTHDERHVVYSLSNAIAWIPADGSGPEEVIHRDSSFVAVPYASADGDTVFFSALRPDTGPDIWQLSLASRQAKPWLASRFAEGAARPSPDGSLVAYMSDETGRVEVFVRPSAGGPRLQVSVTGATGPVWSRNGRELFFLSGGDLYAAAVRSAQPPSLDVPRRLFKTEAASLGQLLAPWVYDVLPDGRFVFIETAAQSRPVELRLVQDSVLRRSP